MIYRRIPVTPAKNFSLTLREDVVEHELEQGRLAHIRKFLIELGTPFAFVGAWRARVGGHEGSWRITTRGGKPKLPTAALNAPRSTKTRTQSTSNRSKNCERRRTFPVETGGFSAEAWKKGIRNSLLSGRLARVCGSDHCSDRPSRTSNNPDRLLRMAVVR
jgi:hypothetical protein